ncbi:S-layer homology domain-containing protein [Paenibacillus xylanilyticus]|uniref:S-layer homology domain-containing protein n=1 Tax=Paenibacillus xylanilyticus TaxID=248903 RepID=UPI0039A2076C
MNHDWKKMLLTVTVIGMLWGNQNVNAAEDQTGGANQITSVFTDETDIRSTSLQAVQEAVKQGLISGYPDGSFHPRQYLTRREMAVLLAKASQLPLEESMDAGLKSTDWAAPYINAIRKAGWMTGDTLGNFRANDPIRREELASILVRVTGTQGIKGGQQQTISDESLVSNWAKEQVQTALKLGLLESNKGRFESQALVERQDIAEILVDVFQAGERTASLTELDGDIAYIDGRPFVIGEELLGILNEGNKEALQNAVVTYDSRTRNLSSLSEIQIKQAGTAAHPMTLDLKGSSYSGVISVSADHVILKADILSQVVLKSGASALTIEGDVDEVTVDTTDKVTVQGSGMWKQIVLKDVKSLIQLPASVKTEKVILPEGGVLSQIIRNAPSTTEPSTSTGTSTSNSGSGSSGPSTPDPTPTPTPEPTPDPTPTPTPEPTPDPTPTPTPEPTPDPTPDPTPAPIPEPTPDPTPTPTPEPTPDPTPAPEDHPPVASSVLISGSKLEAGETLSGSYTYDDQDEDVEGETTFKWYRVDNDGVSNQTLIIGANEKDYTLTAEDSGHKIIFEVTPTDNKGVHGLPTTTVTDIDISDPAPLITGLSAKTPEQQSYFNAPYTPRSDDKDIATAVLWRTSSDGLNYQSPVYEFQSTDYRLGNTISMDGNYKLVVTDKGGNETTAYFTIDRMIPAVTEVVQSQNYGNDPSVYDSGDVIKAKFNNYIKKFDSYDEMSGTGNAAEAKGLTMAALEAAAQQSGHSFGEGAQLTATSYIPVNPLYGNEFEITLGENANLPITGFELELDAADIYTPSKTQAPGDTVSVAIPALEQINHAPVVNEAWTAPEFTVGEAGNLSLTGLFTDEDADDVLTYSIENLTPAIATVPEDSGDLLTITPIAAGTAEFKITASDGKSQKETAIQVTVKPAVEQAAPFISEMVWGSDEDIQAIELYNPTDSPISHVRLTIGGDEIVLDESFSIPAHGGRVIADWNSGLESNIEAEVYYAVTDMNFDPDGTEPLEVVFFINGIPLDSSTLYPQQTMRRKAGITRGAAAYQESEWDIYPVDTMDGLGSYE